MRSWRSLYSGILFNLKHLKLNVLIQNSRKTCRKWLRNGEISPRIITMKKSKIKVEMPWWKLRHFYISYHSKNVFRFVLLILKSILIVRLSRISLLFWTSCINFLLTMNFRLILKNWLESNSPSNFSKELVALRMTPTSQHLLSA